MSNSVWLNFSSLSLLFRLEGFSCDNSVLHVGVVLSQATPWSNLRTKIDSNTDCVDRMWAGHVECPGPPYGKVVTPIFCCVEPNFDVRPSMLHIFLSC